LIEIEIFKRCLYMLRIMHVDSSGSYDSLFFSLSILCKLRRVKNFANIISKYFRFRCKMYYQATHHLYKVLQKNYEVIKNLKNFISNERISKAEDFIM